MLGPSDGVSLACTCLSISEQSAGGLSRAELVQAGGVGFEEGLVRVGWAKHVVEVIDVMALLLLHEEFVTAGFTHTIHLGFIQNKRSDAYH